MSRWLRKNSRQKVTDNSEMMDISGLSVADADAILARTGFVEAPAEVALA
jgi:hypothetical protein